MFTKFDTDKTGFLSLSELEQGIREVLDLDILFKLKPVILKCFQSAKTSID